MTTESEQLEAQSREAIKAWCDDPSVQLEFTEKSHSNSWRSYGGSNLFDMGYCYYRIAEPKKWYRVGQFIDGSLIMVRKEALEKEVQDMTGFTEWLDERKYYD